MKELDFHGTDERRLFDDRDAAPIDTSHVRDAGARRDEDAAALAAARDAGIDLPWGILE